LSSISTNTIIASANANESNAAKNALNAKINGYALEPKIAHKKQAAPTSKVIHPKILYKEEISDRAGYFSLLISNPLSF
jgi:hypothetical protein